MVILYTILNGTILVECKALCHIITFTVEVEIARVFYNAQKIIPIRYILEAISHLQLPILIKTDNSTASGFINNNIN